MWKWKSSIAVFAILIYTRLKMTLGIQCFPLFPVMRLSNRIVAAFGAQELFPLRRRHRPRGVKQFIDPAPPVGIHGALPPNWVWSQARAALQSRFTVRSEIPITLAASPSVSPPK